MLFGHWIPYGTRPQYRNCKRKKRKETHAIHKKQKFLDDTPEDTTPWGIQSTLRAPCKALNPTTRLGNPNKLIQISVRIVLENHKSSRFWFVDITDSDTPQVRPPLEGIAIGLYELKIPQATHWVIFVPQECSATLLRDISARKRCPSAPPRKITEKFRLLTSPRHRHPSFRRIVGALSNLQHIKIIQTYVSTLVNHHSMPQILSALGKMIGTTQNACLSLRPPSRLHWLDQPSKDDNAIHNSDSCLSPRQSPRLSSFPHHHGESCYRYAAKPLFYFQPRPHTPLAG